MLDSNRIARRDCLIKNLNNVRRVASKRKRGLCEKQLVRDIKPLNGRFHPCYPDRARTAVRYPRVPTVPGRRDGPQALLSEGLPGAVTYLCLIMSARPGTPAGGYAAGRRNSRRRSKTQSSSRCRVISAASAGVFRARRAPGASRYRSHPTEPDDGTNVCAASATTAIPKLQLDKGQGCMLV